VINYTNDGLGELVGQLYVKEYFPEDAKAKIFDLVTNIKEAFKERINNLDWMTPETKNKALEKLATMNLKLGYPDKWLDYSSVNVSRESFLQNVLNANSFAFSHNISKVGKPVDRQEWHMTPQTINAYFSPNMNEIVFPAAILQPPFFDFKADDAVNYGAIGAVIAHEMTHGFDDQGRQYDKDGNLTDWWTKADADNFNTKAKVLVEQFNNFKILDSLHVDGELTLGENIADLGGVTISLHALKNANKGKEVEKIHDFTPEQRFFLSYALVWRNNIRDKELMRRIKEDVHSPGDARVNGTVYNVPEFYEAFSIAENSNRFIPIEKRAKIW
jgi:predicted metalloendopeptidase